MKEPARVLLVDLSNITYRAVCSHAMLTHDGEHTGGVYGFLQIVSKLINDHRVNRIVVADDAKPYFRASLFPGYKGGRSQHRSAATTEVRGYVSRAKTQIAEVLRQVGAGITRVPGYEADDIIARATQCGDLTLEGKHAFYFIASNDSDLYQCLHPAMHVAMCRKEGLYGFMDFRTEFPGIQPDEWPRVLALAGSHNGVPGIAGVGLKTAAKLVIQRATSRYIEHKYQMSVGAQRLRERLATYPWRGLQAIEATGFRYNRRRVTAWVYRRFGIEFAPYMHTAFEYLS